MDKKVTQEEIGQLFAFTRKHFVEYYDLQNELTDHLANAIEQRWVAEPALSFDDALKQEFKKFGVFGFMTVVEQRQVALTKKYNRLMWGYFKQFLKFPQIAFTILCVFAVYKAIEYNSISYQVLMMGTLVISFCTIIAKGIKYRKKVKQTGRKWLFEEIIARCGGLAGICYLPLQFSMHLYSESPGLIRAILMAVLAVVFILSQYVILYIIPQKAEEHLLKTYPEYNL